MAASAVALLVLGGTVAGVDGSASHLRVGFAARVVPAGQRTGQAGPVPVPVRRYASGGASGPVEADSVSSARPGGAAPGSSGLPASGTATVMTGPSDAGQRRPAGSTTSAANPGANSPDASSPDANSPVGEGGATTPGGSTAAAGEPAPGGGGQQVPAPGTYTYDTSGRQQISLLGTTTYPARTPLVVSRAACGDSATWKPSPGDSTTLVECPVPGGVRIVSESSTLGAGGYSTTQTFNCGPDAFIPVTSGTPGQTWRWVCTSSVGERANEVARFVGRQTSVVGGIPVSTVEVSVSSALSGPEQGRAWTDYWLTSNATPVREVGGSEVSQNGVTYTSSYTLQLVALAPT